MSPDSDNQLIKKLYKHGKSLRDIARMAGLRANNTVKRRLFALGVELWDKNQ